MHLTVPSLIYINNLVTSLIDITLRNVNVRPYGYDKMCVDKDLVKDKCIN